MTTSPTNAVAFWAGLLTAGAILVFDVAMALGVAGAPTRILAVVASLFIALFFVALMASVHTCVGEEAKVWTQVGLSFAIVYATLLVWNYYLQLTVVRMNPRLYGWLSMDFTKDTAFWSLESIGYTLMSVAALSVLPLLAKGPIARVAGACLIVNAASAVLGVLGYAITGNPLHILVLTSLGVWSVLMPPAIILVALVLRRTPAKRE